MLIKEQRGKKCPKGYPTFFPKPDPTLGFLKKEIIVVGNVSCEDCDHHKFKTTNRPNLDKNGNPYYDRHTREPIMGTDEWCELLLKGR